MKNIKGQSKMIFIVAMLILAVLVIALWVTAVEGWFTGLGEQFIDLAEGEHNG